MNQYKEVDAIILSNTKSKEILDMTESALDSLISSEDSIIFNIYLIETNSDLKKTFPEAYSKYSNLNLILPNEEFNFNKFVNIALGYCKNSLLAILNNDLLFEKSWMTNIIEAMEANNLNSASAFCPESDRGDGLDKKVTLGYNIGTEFLGWCIVIKRDGLNKILPLDERFKFWCVDNDMAMDLCKNNLRHGLVGNSRVHHLGGRTLFKESAEKIHHLTADMVDLFHEKYKK